MAEPTVRVSSRIPKTEPVIQKPDPEPLQAFKEEIIKETKSSTFPTNIVELPSKGLLYDESNALSAGVVEMKYMTAKEENILTTESYITQRIVIDKFLQSMVIAPKFDYDSLLIGDKDALIVAARVYGYGEIYPVEITAPSGKKQKVEIDLLTLKKKEVDEDLYRNRENCFVYEFENRGEHVRLEFKLLTVGDQKKIDEKLRKYKAAGTPDSQITTRLQQMILSVNGNSDPTFVKLFIENEFLSKNSREFREYVASINPGIDLEIDVVDEDTG